MWWEPNNNYENNILSWLEIANGLYREQEEYRQVLGLGTYLAGEFARPFLLLNSDFIDLEIITPQLLPLNYLSNETRNNLEDWQLPENTLALIITEPTSLGSSHSISLGDVIKFNGNNMSGTVGPYIKFDDNKSGILTAGHVMRNGKGKSVDKIKKRWFRTKVHNDIGTVLYNIDPIDSSYPDYDVSVIQLNDNVYFNGSFPNGIAMGKNIANLQEPELCNFFGGVSGLRHNAGIVGALSVFGNHERQWINTWLMFPSSIANYGDSGSLVRLTSSGEAIGLLVAGSKAKSANWYLCWYAQDISSIQNDYLAQYNIKINVC